MQHLDTEDKTKRSKKLLQLSRRSVNNLTPKLFDVWNGNSMPKSLQSCFAFIYHHHLTTKYIFRKNGNKVAHEVLSANLQKNNNSLPTFYSNMAFDVCSALKGYIKDIPGGLLQKELASDWQKLIKITDKKKFHDKLGSLVYKLAIPNKTLLFYTLVLGSAIVRQQNENEMSEKSLSIVLMPCIFEKVIDIRKMKYLHLVYDLLEHMIRSAEFIVGMDLYRKICEKLDSVGRSIRIIPYHLEEINSNFAEEVVESFLQQQQKQTQHYLSSDSGLNSSSYGGDSSSQIPASGTTGSSLEDLLLEEASNSVLLRRNSTLLSQQQSNLNKLYSDSGEDGEGGSSISPVASLLELRLPSPPRPLSSCIYASQEPPHIPVFDCGGLNQLEFGISLNDDDGVNGNETNDAQLLPFQRNQKKNQQRHRSILKRSSCFTYTDTANVDALNLQEDSQNSCAIGEMCRTTNASPTSAIPAPYKSNQSAIQTRIRRRQRRHNTGPLMHQHSLSAEIDMRSATGSSTAGSSSRTTPTGTPMCHSLSRNSTPSPIRKLETEKAKATTELSLSLSSQVPQQQQQQTKKCSDDSDGNHNYSSFF